MSNLNVVLPESLKISDVVAVKELLDETLKGDSSVEIDSVGVSAIDYSGMQLLIAFVRELESRGHSLTWKGVSEPLKIAAEHIGVTSYLHI